MSAGAEMARQLSQGRSGAAPRLHEGDRRDLGRAWTRRSPRSSRPKRCGKDNVIGVRMPYRTSSPESLAHAQLVIDKLGIPSVTVDISEGGGRVSGRRRRHRSHPHRQRDGARADDRAVRPLGEAPGAAARHRQQVRAAARLLHLARRRLAARESAGRPLQDAGLGAGPPRGRAGGDRRQARDRRPDPGADGRGRLRHFLLSRPIRSSTT